jgi:putative nucleotidyltransferase with HDIG domain
VGNSVCPSPVLETATVQISARHRENLRRPGYLAPPSLVRWLRGSLRRFVALIVILAVASLLLPSTWTEPVGRWWLAAIVLTVLAAGLEFVAVPLPRGGDVSVATIAHVAILLLVPAPYAALSIGAAVLFEEVIGRRPRLKVVFNISAFILTAQLTSFAVGLSGSPWQLGRDTIERGAIHPAGLTILLAAGLTYYVLNWLLTSGIIAIASEQSFRYILRVNSGRTALMEIGAETIGALFAVIWMIEPIWTALLVVPSAVISRALQQIRMLEVETRSAVSSLAQIVDHRDPSTFHHSERVAYYAVGLARELGLPEDEVDLIEQAAGVHDLGKIGVPDRVLLKPGELDDGERALMWLHTEIGAQVLQHFQLFRNGRDIVLHHHERWDGAGYPAGLAGEAIPLGSRVLAVADAFDAMTADRPYRRAMRADDALDVLRRGSGSQWDPLAVGAFLRLVGRGNMEMPHAAEDLESAAPAASAPAAGFVADGRLEHVDALGGR